MVSAAGLPDAYAERQHPKFIARALRAWYMLLAAMPLFIEPGSPQETGYVEFFDGKIRDEL